MTEHADSTSADERFDEARPETSLQKWGKIYEQDLAEALTSHYPHTMPEDRRKESRGTPDRRRETRQQAPLIAYLIAGGVILVLLAGTWILIDH